MTIQNQVSTAVVSASEATFGVAAATNAADAKIIRRVTASLNMGKDVYTSNEARPDQQVADVRHGTRRPAGSVEGELANTAYDDWLEALMRGTWTAGVAAATGDYTTVAGAQTSAATPSSPSIGTLTWAAGDPSAKGFRFGDVIRLTGTPGGNNDGVNFRIMGLGGSNNRTVTVTPAPVAFAATGITAFAVVGKKVSNGLLRRSFTLEQLYADIDVSEQFTGMRVGAGTFRLPPNGMATAGFSFMGRDGAILEGAGSPYYTAPTPAGSNKLLAGPSGSVRFGFAEQAVMTGLDIAVDNGLSADPVTGSVYVPDIFYGTQRFTGNVSFYLQDSSLLKVFYNELEVDLTAVLTTAAATPDFLAFNMQRVKTTGVTKSIAAQGGVIVSCPYQALLASAGTGVDGSTLTIQRSV
jgi:hypothetical protein